MINGCATSYSLYIASLKSSFILSINLSKFPDKKNKYLQHLSYVQTSVLWYFQIIMSNPSLLSFVQIQDLINTFMFTRLYILLFFFSLLIWFFYFHSLTGTHISNAEEVAIKLECVKTKHPQLHIESKFYRMMQGGGKSLENIFFLTIYLQTV